MATQRERDLEMLDNAITIPELDRETRERFREMREEITSGAQNALQAKRRQWVKKTLVNHARKREQANKSKKTAASPPKPVELMVGRLPLSPPGRYAQILWKDKQS